MHTFALLCTEFIFLIPLCTIDIYKKCMTQSLSIAQHTVPVLFQLLDSLQVHYMVFCNGSSHLECSFLIRRQPSCQLGQPYCQLVIHFNGKFKHLPGKIFSEMYFRRGSRFHPVRGNLLTPFNVLCVCE